MKSLKRVMIMAGGTGGHVFPGLALANYLQKQAVEVHWLGTHAGLEAKLVPSTHIPFHTIGISGIRGKGIRALSAAPVKISAAIYQAQRILSKFNPDVVLGMGGFVSGPGGIAAWWKRIPLVIHEQNAIAGTTNKILSRFATKVLLGFPDAIKPASNVVAVGNPVRTDIETLLPPVARMGKRKAGFNLLILGGSLGAKVLNETVPEALALLPKHVSPSVIHQTGERHYTEAKSNYESKGIEATVKPFLEDMASAYDWADLVICRAGALTVAELCQVGLGAIFIPFPYATDDHQTANAMYMVKHTAGICMPQFELSPQQLADTIKRFMENKAQCLNLAQQAYSLRQDKVTEKIFNVLSSVSQQEGDSN